MYRCNSYIVPFVITIGISVMHCVSVVMTVVVMDLQKQSI